MCNSMVTISVLIALVMINYLGQRIIDKKEEVFHSAYFETKWYMMPPLLRRWIHIILICSTDCSALTAGKVGDVSLEACGIVHLILYYSTIRKNLV